MSQKVSYTSKIFDKVINGFSPHELGTRLHIRDHSIVTFGKRGLCLRFSNTSHVEILDFLEHPLLIRLKQKYVFFLNNIIQKKII